MACQLGLADEVTAFVHQNRPSQAVRQYALEKASFENQPAIARYLLEHDTVLHSCVFGRGTPMGAGYLRELTVFDKFDPEINLVPLIQVFLDFGWHPNQAWNHAQYDEGKTPLPYEGCLANRQLVELLLQHGADPNIGTESYWEKESPPMNRVGGEALDGAARLGGYCAGRPSPGPRGQSRILEAAA